MPSAEQKRNKKQLSKNTSATLSQSSLDHTSAEGILSPELQEILVLLKKHTGNDFSSYKLTTLNHRIERQMAARQVNALKEYVAYLQEHPQEIDKLYKELLINVTTFFRDAMAFDVLQKSIIPNLLIHQTNDALIRIWAPGCSTGEEAYSLAIILHECMEELKFKGKIQIFATDIDNDALELARKGLFDATAVIDITAERLERFFHQENGHYSICQDIYNMVTFGTQNLVTDPPYTNLNLICCRNVLIYLDAVQQKQSLLLFHCSLKPGGILFLGPSESIASATHLFNPLIPQWKIFARKDLKDTQELGLLNEELTALNYDLQLRIDQLTTAESKLSELNKQLQIALKFSENIFNTVREPLLVLTPDLKITSANRAFYQAFEVSSELVIDKHIYEICDEQWNTPDLKDLLHAVIKNNKLFENYEINHKFPSHDIKKIIFNARRIINDDPNTKLILVAMELK